MTGLSCNRAPARDRSEGSSDSEHEHEHDYEGRYRPKGVVTSVPAGGVTQRGRGNRRARFIRIRGDDGVAFGCSISVRTTWIRCSANAERFSSLFIDGLRGVSWIDSRPPLSTP